MSDFGSIIDWFNNIGDIFSGIAACIPDFLKPIAIAFVVVSAIYLIVGRD